MTPWTSSHVAWIVAALISGSSYPSRAEQLLNAGFCSSTSPDSLTWPKGEFCQLPVNDPKRDKKKSLTPWARERYCLKEPSDDLGRPEFCLFTSETFRGGYGLSVITTPELAASLEGALDDASAPLELLNHPSSPLASAPESSLAWEIRDFPGRGKGLVAKRLIKKWEVIMVNWPVMLIRADLFDDLSPGVKRQILDRAAAQLPGSQHDAIRQLAQSMSGGVVENVLHTNAFSVEVNGIGHVALFTNGSRVNHNCQPNVYWTYSTDSLTQRVIAMRDIQEGEEIGHSYAPLGLPREARHQALRDWGFTCACQLCSASSDLVELSDKRRVRMWEICRALEDEDDISKEGIASLAKELFYLVDQEQVWPQLVAHYEIVARAYMRIGALVDAKRFVSRTEKTWIEYGGVKHDNVEGIKTLRRDLHNAAAQSRP